MFGKQYPQLSRGPHKSPRTGRLHKTIKGAQLDGLDVSQTVKRINCDGNPKHYKFLYNRECPICYGSGRMPMK